MSYQVLTREEYESAVKSYNEAKASGQTPNADVASCSVSSYTTNTTDETLNSQEVHDMLQNGTHRRTGVSKGSNVNHLLHNKNFSVIKRKGGPAEIKWYT